MQLAGPFPLDLQVPEAGARAALSAWRARGGRLPTEGEGRGPGLYLILEGAEPALIGLWAVLDQRWMADGPGPSPDRLPPLAEPLLEAMVEAIWWRDLRVAGRKGGAWEPLIVLEWPPKLAVRSAAPPPGVQAPEIAAAAAEAPEEEGGGWLELGAGVDTAIRPRPAQVSEEEGISPHRSRLCLIRGRLSQEGGGHEGRFRLVMPVGEASPTIPASTWGQSRGAAGEEGADLPLELPRGGVGYALPGWLLRSLDLWPAQPSELQEGQLARRDLRSEAFTRLAQAVALTLLVSLPTLALALTVRQISLPRVTSAPEPKTIDPQPAISVCSTEHERFVAELRCQIEAMAEPDADVERPACAELGPTTPTLADLQPLWCGLMDRERDGRPLVLRRAGKELPPVSPAAFAATQACFNVLGQPDPYLLQSGPGDGPRKLGNPISFLEDAELRIQPLDDLVAALDLTCDQHRSPLELRVEGAIFATHVGGAGPESGPLREELVRMSIAEEGELERRCFEAGVREGPATATMASLCGGVPLLPSELAAEAWSALAGQGALSSVEDYARARFPQGLAGAAGSSALWRCHLELASGADRGPAPTLWDLRVWNPVGYAVQNGAIQGQLELDAMLGAVREAAQPSPCLTLVADRLDAYTPVHPLLGEAAEDSAWSVEQQLCGQTCAAYYRVAEPTRGSWITRETDLSECVNRSSPLGAEPIVDGTGVRDHLWIPWYGQFGDRLPGWSDVCSFNLLAQGLLPEPEGGLLPGGLPGVAWAGETSLGSRIAGGEGGAAVQAARNLDTYGRSRSRESCGHVATQCFTTLLLDVTRQRPSLDPYLWPSAWSSSVSRLLDPRGRSRQAISPWCEEILPYLKPDGVLPEGQFDYPCAKGVDEARQRVAASILRIAAQEQP